MSDAAGNFPGRVSFCGREKLFRNRAGSGNVLRFIRLFQMPQGISPNEEADDEDIDHDHCRRSPLGGYFFGSGSGHNGISSIEQHAKVTNDRKFSILYQHVRERWAELQIREYGGLRKRRKAAKSELFADPNKSTTGAK